MKIKNKKTKLIFFGSGEFALQTLKILLKIDNIEIIKVVTKEPKKFGRKNNLLKDSKVLKFLKESNNISYWLLKKVNLEFKKKLKLLDCQNILLVDFGVIIPNSLIDNYKIINVHPSLLPLLRGPSPFMFTIFNNLKESGITLLELTKEIDAGDIFAQEKITLNDNENTLSLQNKLFHLNKQLLNKYLYDIFNNKITPKKQDHSKATFSKMIKPEMLELDWSLPFNDLKTYFKAFSHKYKLYSFFNNKRFNIFEIKENISNDKKVYDLSTYKNGQIIAFTKNGVLLKYNNNKTLFIVKWQQESKKIIETKIYFNNVPKFFSNKK